MYQKDAEGMANLKKQSDQGLHCLHRHVCLEIKDHYGIYSLFKHLIGCVCFSLEVAVEPWIDGLLAAVKRQLYGSNTDSSIFDHTREVIKLNREAQLSTPVESNDNTSVHSGSDVTAKATPVDQSHSSDAGTVRTKRQESENTNQSNSVKNSNAEKKDINAEIGNAEQTTNKSDSISRDKQESIMESATVSLTSKLDSLALIDQSKVLDRLTASQNSLPDLKLAIQSNEQAGDPTENRTTHSVDSSSNSNLSEETETSSSVQTEEGSLSVESLSLDIPNIRQSVPPLSDSNLNVPVLSPAYLKMDYQPGVQLVSLLFEFYHATPETEHGTIHPSYCKNMNNLKT